MKKSNIEAIIAARYNNDIVIPKRKNITFNIDEELLERLDFVVNVFNEKDGGTTRNAVIEDAILGYVQTSEDYFGEQSVKNDTPNGATYDTAVFPCLNSNFNEVFLGRHQWYYVRIAAYRVENIKYIALYRGTPVSAITHYAEVIRISEPNEDNKRSIEVKDPTALHHPIVLDDTHVNNVRKLFYTSLEKLQSVNKVGQLLKK